MTHRCCIVVLLCVGASGLCAQETNTSPHAHHMATSNMIDGAVHPERIPDSTAHRLFFLAHSVSPGASEDEKMRQNAHLRRIGLSEDDHKTLVLVLADFKVQYQAFMDRWNEAAMSALAKNQPFNATEFLRQRDALVQSTRNALASALTQDGYNLLRLHINAQKSKMKVNPGEAQ